MILFSCPNFGGVGVWGLLFSEPSNQFYDDLSAIDNIIFYCCKVMSYRRVYMNWMFGVFLQTDLVTGVPP